MKYEIKVGGLVVNTIVSDPANIAAIAASMGGTFAEVIETPPPAPTPTSDDVNAERARRIEAGTDISVDGYGPPVALQGRITDQLSLLALNSVAQQRIAAGDMTTLTAFRDRNNTDHQLTPAQMVNLWQRGMIWVEAMHGFSVVLKDATPIAADYADDGYWAV